MACSESSLNKGEIAPYIQKYKSYWSQTKGKILDTVNFSGPIFPQTEHIDDMSYFISQRLDEEFRIINSDQYRLYGNQQGKYPVQTKVLGDMTKNNIQKKTLKV